MAHDASPTETESGREMDREKEREREREERREGGRERGGKRGNARQRAGTCPREPSKPCVDAHGVRGNTHRGARTHDHKVKGLALCRLS